MGSKKNASTHVSRGKFKKRKVPKKAMAVSSSTPTPPVNGSRIINLENIQEHMQTVVNHATSCPSTSRNSADDQIAITMNKTHCDGLVGKSEQVLALFYGNVSLHCAVEEDVLFECDNFCTTIK